MPSGNVTLLEAAKTTGDVLKRGVVEVIIQESSILDQLPMMTIKGDALRHRVEESLPTPMFRDVNEAYTASWGTDTEHFWGTAILGQEVKVDNYLVNVMGDQEPVKARQFEKTAKAVALMFDKTVFDGTGVNKDFKGINSLVTEGFGQSLAAGANGATLTLDMFDQANDMLRTASQPDAIYLNRTNRRKLTTLARNVSGQFPLIGVTELFGKQVTTWNEVPLRIVGDDHTGSAILGFDETQGSSNIASSIYFVRFGTDLVCGLMGLGGSMEVRDFGEQEAAPVHMGRVEFYPGLAIFDRYAVVRLAGVLAG